MVGPASALADSNTGGPLADQIETLSLDRDPDIADADGLGWVLYPPLHTHWRQITVQGCVLTLQSFDQEGDLQTATPIDLVVARLIHFESGLPYEFFELSNPDPALMVSAGLLRFTMPNTAPVLGQIRAGTSETNPAPMITRHIFEPAYEMWHNPSRETVAALASAILSYQQQVCQPLG